MNATEERDALRAFAQHMLDGWPDFTGLDGGEIQDAAIKHGLLVGETRTTTCAEDCACAEYHGTDSPGEFTCYRRTALLKGGE
jgi:hypothetical protein